MPADVSLEELPDLAAYAARVTRRLARPSRLAVEQPLGRGADAADWFLARSEASARAARGAARAAEVRDFPTPWTVTAAQAQCQKPFHLWNVTREEWSGAIAFERGLRYVLGRAAHEHGPTSEGRPGKVTGATALAHGADREREETHEHAWAHRRGLFQLLGQDPARSGLGRRAPETRTSPGSGGVPTTWTAPPDSH